MTAMTHQTVIRQPRPSSLADVLDLVLDKGMVIDAYVRVSLVGIELVTIDARVVIASVDTYLRFASMTNRLDLKASDTAEGLPQLMHEMTESGASDKTQGALSGVAKQVSSWFGGGDDDDNQRGNHRQSGDGESRRRPPRARATSSSRSRGEGRTSRSRETQRRRRSDEDDDEER